MSTAARCLLTGLVVSFLARHSEQVSAADINTVRDAGQTGSGFRPLVADDRPVAPRLAPSSQEGELRIKQFRHVPGLKIDLWAAEPMLANPVAFSVDELGRVFTSETYRYRTSVLDIRHYMFMLEDDLASRSIEDRLANIRKWFGPEGEQQLSRETEVIRLLEDTDHDGKADRSTVFAEGLNSPLDGIASGVLARHGQVWLTDIPSLWKFSPSSTGKDAAPAPRSPVASSPRPMKGYQAEELLRGWGVRFSFTGHDLHGLKFGPDGRLYFSVGDRGTHVTTKEGQVIDLPDEGAVFRCEPDGTQLQVVHRGLRNPQELAFNEYGDLFTGDNDSDQGDRERWVQVVEGADSAWRVGYQHAPLGNAGPWNMERLWVPHFEGQAAYLFPPLANIGDGPSGLVYDYGTSFPAGLTHRFLLAYFKGTSAKSGVYSLRNRPVGAGYELSAHDEFVWNALVPDVDLGPDGGIWFADWHEGWPKSNKGRLYRAYFPEVLADPVVKETAKLLAEGMTQRDESQLLGLLTHRDMRVRQEAQFELAARGPKSLAGLKKVAIESRNQLARFHAIWGVGQILRSPNHRSSLPEALSLAELFTDEDAEVQAQSIRVFSELPVSNYSLEIATLTTNANPRVRAAALTAYPRLFARGNDAYLPTLNDRARIKFLNWWKGSQPQLPAGATSTFTVGPGLRQDLVRDGLLYDDASDPVLRHAKVECLTKIGAYGFTELFGITDTNSASNVRILGLLARRKLADPSIQRFLSDPDPLLVLEAARAINDVPITNAVPALAALGEPGKIDTLLGNFAALKPLPAPVASPGSIRDVRADQPLPWGDAPIDSLTPMLLRVVNANFRIGTPEAAERLGALARHTDLADLIRKEALFALFDWSKRPARDRVVGTYRPLAERKNNAGYRTLRTVLPELLELTKTRPAVTLAACEALNELPVPETEPILEKLVRNDQAPANVRAAALRSWVFAGRTDAGFSSQSAAMGEFKLRAKALLQYASAQPQEELRLESSKLDADLNPDDAVGQLAAKLTSGSIPEQQSAFASLGSLKSPGADAVLSEWLDKLMKREVANEVMLDLIQAARKRSSHAVKTRLAAYQEWKLPKDALSPYREALFGGDAARGKKVFYENAAVACTRCHQIGADGGGNAGPKLDGVASRQPREYLLESVVLPNQQIVQGFETALITLKNGQTYAGLVKSENDTALILLSPEEGDIPLKKSDVQSREKGLSGMPEGFGDLLSREDLRDVVEFLGTLK